MHYAIEVGDSPPTEPLDFDLCILDGPVLDQSEDWVQACRAAQKPAFLPFLLLTSHQEVNFITRHLWRSIDELVTKPIEKIELQARVAVLMRARTLSLELKSANAHLEALNILKARFMAMATHECRNPLNVIVMSANLIERANGKPKGDSQFFELIKKSVKKITHLLDDVLVLGQAEAEDQPFNPKPTDLIDLCTSVIQEIQVSFGYSHTLDFQCSGEPLVVDVDRQLIEQILTNLLSNALKYSPPGSTVRLRLAYRDSSVLFEIQDEGIGITQQEQQRLFEVFFRAENVGDVPGTGLGLAIVKRCVERHGGRIGVESEVGNGSTFLVEIPVLVNCAEPQAASGRSE